MYTDYRTAKSSEDSMDPSSDAYCDDCGGAAGKERIMAEILIEAAEYSLPEYADWRVFRRRRYTVWIRRADETRVYNVPGEPGVVYNFLEDSREHVRSGGYVVTGLCGELYPIGPEMLAQYSFEALPDGDEPVPCVRRQDGGLWRAVRIPASVPYCIRLDDGNVAKGNAPGVSHGEGDWIVCSDGARNFRSVNGLLFDRLFEEA
jgi:hypothetical protein